LLVIAKVVSSSSILVSLMMEEALRSSETSVLTIATRRNIPGDGIFKVTEFSLDIFGGMGTRSVEQNICRTTSLWLVPYRGGCWLTE
jgi:hypothetical protein